MRAAKVQASLRIRAVSPEPSLLAHTNSESRGTFRQKARSLAPLNGWACAVEICHDGMLEDTNSLDGAHIVWLTHIGLVDYAILINWASPFLCPQLRRSWGGILLSGCASIRASICSSHFLMHAISYELCMLGFWTFMYGFLMKK